MEVKQIGNVMHSNNRENPNQGRVYDKNHIAPTLTDMQGGGRQPKIINEPKCLNSKGGRAQQIKIMTETVRIKQATSQGYIECEVGGVADLSFPDSNTRRGRVQEKGQVSPTLMAGETDICRIENVYDFYNNNLKSDGVCGTLTSACSHNGSGTFGVIEPQYRIRKLTPIECWRLMDFKDEDFRKVAEVNSNTQLYKQAGNSIVKNVLVAIIGQMIPGKEEVYKEGSK